jgi:hypothetical protein
MSRVQLTIAAMAVILPMMLSAQETAPAAPKNDYRDGRNWLCRPDRLPGQVDACEADLTTSIVNANGKVTTESFVENPQAPIDCFYVYPTVSLDPTPNADMQPGPEEHHIIRQQFARFGSKCRRFAPLYRQITLTALQAMVAGSVMKIDGQVGYADVLDAWNDYLKHDNQGRGVVLIGHSQGASVLMELIAKEIDGKPIQDKLVSALLLGWNVAVPKNQEIGGAFKSIPLCRTEIQAGCVVTYASFRATSPPPSNARFGRLPNDDLAVACTNPASLKGGSAPLHAYLSNREANNAAPPPPWAKDAKPLTTPFVSVPGLLSAECINKDGASYLAITMNGDPQDPRVDDIAGDVIRNGSIQRDWGLHLIDMNLAMGNLVHIVGEQAKGYLKLCDCKN